ncbi:hypothetical protein [Granulosicoccus antarcticus]|uniref:Lipoprotein n=1 Tax=Granulosicoccus antarcticus IMCC3135 TaxID=1192854 RepID=A0A2Z2P1T4_9GAMM|nr:hypothetical protein [Granulosicoccus antarcticus]ASJ75240.1 hypothetical protein IMCC3135_25925 [Granulosicoccus antarcticus IMCC3135]
MLPVRLFTLLFASMLFSSACATVTPAESEAAPLQEPALIEVLPDTLQSFDLQGYKYFQDSSGGYSVRYANLPKRRIADVYIYPVADENIELAHDQLVLGSTRATIQAIGEAARQGHYANFNVVNAGTQAYGVRTVARVQATYLRQNLASMTLVYQTEYKGTLVKIRVSMPDNESNRNSQEWDDFAENMFSTIITQLDESASISLTAVQQ